MTPAKDLLSIGGDALSTYEETILDFGRYVRPPTMADFPPTLAALIDLQRALGSGWQIPCVGASLEAAEELLQAMLGIEIPGEPTEGTYGLVGEHPVWATLQNVPIGWNSPSCLLAFSFYLDSKRKRSAAERLRTLLRTLDKPYGKKLTKGQVVAAVPPADNPADYFAFLYRFLFGQNRADLFFGFTNLNYISRLPELRGGHRQFSERYPEHDSDQIAETYDIYSAPLPDQDTERLSHEPPDETLSGLKWVELDQQDSELSLRMQFVHAAQRHRAHNALYLEEHVSGLVEEEAWELAQWLLGIAKAQQNATAPLVALMMLITGRDAHTAQRAIEPTTHPNRPVQYQPFSGSIKVALPALDRAFQPSIIQQSHYLDAAREVNLQIPLPLDNLLRGWQRNSTSSSISALDPREDIAELLSKFRADKQIPVYLPQLQRTLGNLLYRHSGDPVIAQWLTGDFNSHSDAPHYYVAIEQRIVQNAYTKAIWPIIVPDETLPVSRQTQLVGAQSRVDPQFLTAGIHRLGIPFKDPKFSIDNLQTVIRRHNRLVTYVTAMLVVFAGHRPVNSLLRLNRWDFDLDDGLALFSDKRCDPAHLVRPVVLGRRLTEQLILYTRHLQKLYEIASGRTEQRKNIRQVVRKAQRGEEPWFFWLSANGARQRLSITWWNKQFQKFFPNLEPNFGRTLLASQFRELQPRQKPLSGQPTPADLAHIQLGHLELSGQPFDSNSPTDLISLGRAAGPMMDELFTLQGWQQFGGLVKFPKRKNLFQREDADWFNLAAGKRSRKEMHKAWKTRTRKGRRKFLAEAQATFGSQLIIHISEDHPELAEQIRAQFDESLRPPEPEEPIHLKPEQISRILARTKDRKDRAVLTNILADVLQTGKKEGWYSGALPRRYAPVAGAELTPYLPGMFKARHCIQTLRQKFVDRPAKGSRPAEPASPEQALARLVIALILYGGVTDRTILLAIINHHSHAIPNPLFADGILVPVFDETEPASADDNPPGPTVWALWHLAAIALLHYSEQSSAGEDLSSEDLTSKTLDTALAAELSEFVNPPQSPKRWLDALLKQAAVVASIERSGIAAFALDPWRGSWSLPISRQFALLAQVEDRYTAPSHIPQRARPQDLARVPDQFVASVKQALPRMPTGKTKSERALNNQRYRKPAIRKIERLLKNTELSALEQAIGQHAVALLKAKKSDGDHYAFRTIFQYVSVIADRLAQALKFQDLSLLGIDEYVDIYANIIDEVEHDSTRGDVARELVRFHGTLEKSFGAPPLAKSDLSPERESLKTRVDASILVPDEVNHARELLDTTFRPTTSGTWRDDQREGLQSLLMLDLLASTGTRTGEIYGLEQSAIYQANGKTWLLIKKNHFRSVKSRRARRKICLSAFMDDDQLELLNGYCSAEQERIDRTIITRLRSYLLFLDLYVVHKGRPLGPAGLNQTRTVITEALRAKTADLARPYHLRHTLGTRAQLDIGLGLPRALGQTRPKDELQIDSDNCLRCRLPVDAARIMGHFGHASFKTTNRSYGHLPWSYLYPQARTTADGLDERSGYFLLRKQEPAANRAMNRSKEDGLLARLVKRMSNHRTLKKRRRIASASPAIEELPTTLPPAAVYLIDMARHGGVNPISYAISDDADQAYRKADQLVAACTGISFFDSALRQTGFPRLYSESVSIFNLAHAISKRPAQLHGVLRSFLQLADHHQPTRIRLPKDDKDTLEDLTRRFSLGITLKLSHEDAFKQEFEAFDANNRKASSLLVWTLSLCAVLMHARSGLDAAPNWRRRCLF